jgi:Secretion system C-terminal sorting domain
MKFYQIILFCYLWMQMPRAFAQNPTADTARPNMVYNHFGAWIWKIDYTNKSHAQLADKLAALGVKRVYIKVSDGRHEASKFPELNNKHTVEIYKNRGLEVWAWSYNYPNNETEQASVLTRAAKTGYAGYVLDLEIEFDDKPADLKKLLVAFDQAKKNAVKQGFTNSDFKLYCTTWGNPSVHRMSVGIIDKYVDAHLPQTYLEEWNYGLKDPAAVIRKVNAEYRRMGATKPIHHIASLQRGTLQARQLNEFFVASGAETSLWRVPGHGISMRFWETWEKIDWNYRFGNLNEAVKSSKDTLPNITLAPVAPELPQITKPVRPVLTEFTVFPNPFGNQITVRCNRVVEKDFFIQLSDGLGQVVHYTKLPSGSQELVIFTAQWQGGTYYLQIFNSTGFQRFQLLKFANT